MTDVDEIISDELLRERIRRLAAPPRSERAFARFLRHPAGLVIVAFVFTTVAGGMISYLYQRQAAETQRRASIQEARREMAMTTFREIGHLMDRRLLWGSQYYDALSTDTSRIRRRELATRFDSTIWAWREGYSTNVASVCRYFGPANSRVLTDTIGDMFSRLARGIHEYGIRPGLADRSFFPLYDSLRTRILAFDMRLVEMVRTGETGDVAGGACADGPVRDTTAVSRR